jgi:hypothetical protein
MSVRRLSLLVLTLGLTVPVGCLRKSKQDSVLPGGRGGNSHVPAPTPPLPTGKFAEIQPATGVLPPKLELAPGSVPPLPGMPGSASQPVPASVPDGPQGRREPDSDVTLASMSDDDPQRKRLLERLRERRQEREKEKAKLPELPPAVEPKKEEPKPLPKERPAPAAEPQQPLPKASATKPEAKSDLAAVRGLVDEAAKRFKGTPDFEAKLTKRETVKGQKQPTEEMRFLFRQEPFSVRLTVTGEVGNGREVLYVKGQNDGKLVIVTGKGDNRLLGAGKKIELDPDSSLATSRTRGRIEESGLGRPIRVLTKFVQEAEDGKREAGSIRSLGAVQRKEFATPVDGVEVALKPSDDPLLPKGGKRLYYFDSDAKSPSYRLPMLVITYEPNDAEVEYYLFTDFKLPANLTDAHFSADNLGRRK